MGKRVLVVDDAAFMRMMVRDALAKQGHEVVGEAANGRIAIDQYKALSPDVVFMDITMPEMTGLEAVAGIRAFDPTAKIIMCSAMGQQGMVIDAIKAGAIDFIVKPFQMERITEAMKKVK